MMIEEIILALLGLLLLVAVVVCVLVLPVFAFLQGRRIARLRQRLDRLEQQWEGLRAAGPADAIPAAPGPLPEEPPAEEPIAAALVEEVAPDSPFVESAAAPRRTTGEAFETWIGRHGLGWVAVVLLLLASAFFLKHAFDNRWIGELGRATLGIVAGVALCGAGLRYHVLHWRIFSQMLTAGGVVLLYLATFGAFGYWDLLPREHAAVFLVVLIAETAALAVLYEAPAIALMAVIGALLTPPLMHTGHDSYRALFLYLAIVNAGVLGIGCFRRWPLVGTVALLGTQGLFWAWHARNYHPEKMVAAIAFQVAVFVIFFAYSLVTHALRRRRANIEDLIRAILNAVLFFAAAYTLLDEDYHVWMGSFALAMAVVYTALGWLVLKRRPDDGRQLLVVVAVAMGFVAMVLPLQADAAWVTLGWAVQGLALWCFGLRIRAGGLRGMGTVLLALAAGRLVFVDAPDAHYGPFVPLLNQYGLPAMAVAGCVLGAAVVAWRARRRLGSLDRFAVWAAGITAIVLFWFILSTETYEYFDTQISTRAADVHGHGREMVDDLGRPAWIALAEQTTRLRRTAQMTLSVVWAVYAAVILAAGFRLRSSAIRWAALALFTVTLGKVVLVDMAGLPGFYRVATFLVLAVMLAVAAWAYQRLQLVRPAVAREDTEDVSR